MVNKVSAINKSITEATSDVHASTIPTSTTNSVRGQVAGATPHIVYPFACNVPFMKPISVPPIGNFSG